MQPNLREAKTALRAQVRVALKKISLEARTVAGARACALLRQQSIWQTAGSVLFYAPMPAELDIWPLLRDALADGKRVALPRFDVELRGYVACQVEDLENDVAPGQFKVREPLKHCTEFAL